MLFLGAVYISGNIAPYLLTYFHYKGQTDLSETDTFYILPLIFLFGTFFLPLGGRLSRRLKPRVFVLCVAPIGLIGMFISAYMTNYWAWFGLFCPSFGFVNGLLYIVPVQVAWTHFPKRIGLAGGIVVSGCGLGAFFFNFISTALANPKNLDSIDGLYPKEVGENVPFMI